MAYALGAVLVFALLAGIYVLHGRLTRRTVRDYEESLAVAPESRRRRRKP